MQRLEMSIMCLFQSRRSFENTCTVPPNRDSAYMGASVFAFRYDRTYYISSAKAASAITNNAGNEQEGIVPARTLTARANRHAEATRGGAWAGGSRCAGWA